MDGTAQALPAFLDALNAVHPGWKLANDELRGPGGAIVRLHRQHALEVRGHFDVQFVVGPAAMECVLHDCVQGFGDNEAEMALTAAHTFAQTTAYAGLELGSLRGGFANHCRGHEPNGFTGWHCIHSPVLGFGIGPSGQALVDWWLSHAALPALAPAIGDALDELQRPVGVKILFGGPDVAEVRIDGQCHAAASDALAALPWPRLEPPGFLRCYLVLLHREPTTPKPGLVARLLRLWHGATRGRAHRA